LALAILLVFWAFALPKLELSKWALDIRPDAGKSVWFPKGALGVLASLPFAIWFFLGIEELPLAAEESHDPKRDMPRGILLGLVTLIACAFLTLITSAGIAPGAELLAKSNEPLFLGFQTLFGVGAGSKLLALIAVAGFIASFHTIIFAYGRQIYSLSRAGYFPRWLSLTHSTRRTPHVALWVGAALGYAVAYAIHRAGSGHPVGAVLLNMAVFGAVISYALQMLSFILLRVRRPNIERPFRSPVGVWGAAIAMAIAVVSLVSLFIADPIYQKVVIGAAIWFALGLCYFAFYGRHHLVVAPEEEFAIRDRS
jgi:ethanolamine permease